jgi:phosphatidylserine/phosphatidylglycerophosphate/cardiolipin synthase-like enzyme
MGTILTNQQTEYNHTPYLHAKCMIFEFEDGSKTAITGSHNFVHGGVLLGTREIALKTNNAAVIKQLEAFIKIYEERELPYWHSVAKKYREQVNALLSERTALQQTYQGHQETAARHSETAANQRRATQDYVNQRKTETNTVLNSEKEPSTHGNS